MNKITLPIALIISALVLGTSFFAVQLNKQNSIERQQLRELEEKRESRQLEEATLDFKQKIETEKVQQVQDNAASLEQCLLDAEEWVEGALQAIMNRSPDPSNKQALEVSQNGYLEMKEECYRKYD